MGQIQQNINSMIGSAAILAGLYANTPAGRAREQLRLLKGQEKGLIKQASTLMTSPEYQDTTKLQATEQVGEEIKEKLQQNRGAQFYNNPNAKNLRKYVNSINIAQQAEGHLDEQQMVQRAQNAALENRLNMLRDKVGDRNLTPEEQANALQQLINERKQGGIK